MKNKKQLAGIYHRYKCQLDSIPEKWVVEFRERTASAFDRLQWSGVKFVFTPNDPYDGLESLSHDVFNNNEIKIYSGDNNSKLLPEEYNLYFRAVHDWIHYLHQLPFGFDGEYKVYEIQKLLYPQYLWTILYSEIVLQTAYFEVYGNFPEQKVITNI